MRECAIKTLLIQFLIACFKHTRRWWSDFWCWCRSCVRYLWIWITLIKHQQQEEKEGKFQWMNGISFLLRRAACEINSISLYEYRISHEFYAAVMIYAEYMNFLCSSTSLQRASKRERERRKVDCFQLETQALSQVYHSFIKILTNELFISINTSHLTYTYEHELLI